MYHPKWMFIRLRSLRVGKVFCIASKKGGSEVIQLIESGWGSKGPKVKALVSFEPFEPFENENEY